MKRPNRDRIDEMTLADEAVRPWITEMTAADGGHLLGPARGPAPTSRRSRRPLTAVLAAAARPW